MSLKSYSLVRMQGSADSFSIHPLVHYWARVRLDNEAKKRLTRKALLILLEVVESADAEVINGLLEHSMAPHVDAATRNAQAYLSRAEHPKLEPPVTQAGELHGKVVTKYGNFYPWEYNTNSYLYNLGQRLDGYIVWIVGHVCEASLFFRRRYIVSDFYYDWRTVYKLTKGTDGISAQRSLEVLRWSIQEAWHDLPKRHRWTLEIIGDYAWEMSGYQSHAKGCGSFDSVVESYLWYIWLLMARQDVLGKSHTATAGALMGIGQAYNCFNLYSYSWDLLDRALRLRIKSVGPSDVMTHNALRRLSFLFGRWSLAAFEDPAFRRARIRLVQYLRQHTHPEFVFLRAQLQGKYPFPPLAARDSDANLDLWLNALETCPKYMGSFEDGGMTDSLRKILAAIKMIGGKAGVERAMSLLDTCLVEVRKQAVGSTQPNDYRPALILNEKGGVLVDMRSKEPELYYIIEIVCNAAEDAAQYDEQLSLLVQMIDIHKSSSEALRKRGEIVPDSARSAILQCKVATCLVHLNRKEEALIAVTEALAASKALLRERLSLSAQKREEVPETLESDSFKQELKDIASSFISSTRLAATLQEELGNVTEAEWLYLEIQCTGYLFSNTDFGIDWEAYDASTLEIARIMYNRQNYFEALGWVYRSLIFDGSLGVQYELYNRIQADTRLQVLLLVDGPPQKQKFARELGLLIEPEYMQHRHTCQIMDEVGAVWTSRSEVFLDAFRQWDCPAIEICPFLNRAEVYKANPWHELHGEWITEIWKRRA